ncbi:tyrosine-type recombinase/integrase [Paraburkholderia tuberum]|uniref:Site-specific recombinase XerD n=1 Tax=Paraburkholderia tuberum TaxID=157910 RepID=A0A1H1KI36_9BURK|nr:tyrosine-type recombinase/integrase [Paraburkholderia tuberum]SDR61439.1 Site-specific recombinase XerD [Paraburkholderia tuberum]
MKRATTMVSLVEDYLECRRRLGFALESEERRLLCFARFADQIGHRGPITEELALRWACSSSRTTATTRAGRLRILSPFAKYRLQFDPATEIASPGLCGPGHRRLTPHIYSEEEIDALLDTARRLPPAGSLRPVTCETVFGLLAATGLRISEALDFRRSDVDLERGLLTIRQSKFRKARQVPLHPTTTEALRTYVCIRDKRLPASTTDAFFVSDRGRPVNYRQIAYAFARLRAQLGWQARGGHPHPRIHDLRHSFICRRLIGWYQEGIDVGNAMLVLSTYVGHTQVTDTFWYITAIPELMTIAGDRFEHFVQGGNHA